MRKEDLFEAIGNIDSETIERNVRTIKADVEGAADNDSGNNNRANGKKIMRTVAWKKWTAVAALFILFAGAGLLVYNHMYFGDDSMRRTNDIEHTEQPGSMVPDGMMTVPSRGGDSMNVNSSENTSETINGETINVYENSPIGINEGMVEKMRSSLVAEGWSDTKCTMLDEYGFILKGIDTSGAGDLSDTECTELVKEFLRDSNLEDILKEAGIEYEIVSPASDGITQAFCYFLCNGSRTGAYIRFVFEDYKSIGEVQAYIYSGKCIDTMALLPVDVALNNAYKVTEDGSLSEINAADYSINSVELIYKNGLPYYTFNGYGINTRGFMKGYALAIDIETSSVSEKLMEMHMKTVSSMH